MKSLHLLTVAPAILLCAVGCPQPPQQSSATGTSLATGGSSKNEGCVITRKPDAEDAIDLVGPSAWVYEFEGGVVNLKVQVYRKIVDSLASDKIIAPENLVYEQQSIDSLFFVFDEVQPADFVDAHFHGLNVVTLPNVSNAEASLGFATRLEHEVDGHRQSSTHSGNVQLGSFLPESYFSEKEKYKNETSSLWSSGQDQATLLPGESTQLVDIVKGRQMTDDQYDAVAIVLTAERLGWEDAKDRLLPKPKQADAPPAEAPTETPKSDSPG